MKKVLSVLLAAVILCLSVSCVTAFAASADEATPIIYLRGNGEKIYNADGEEVTVDIGDFEIGGSEEDAKNKIVEACVNILVPFFTDGLVFDKWNTYAEAIYEEISPMFKEAILDGNGNPQYGTGVSPKNLADSEKRATMNLISGGRYDFYSYSFCYDWRLDPYEHVDRLHEYIKTVIKATGKDQVSLTSRCLGGSVLNAYLEKYGSEGLIKNVMYCETLSDGCALISKGFSGQIEIDSRSMQRYLGQLEYCDEIGFGVGLSLPEIAGEIVTKTFDLLTQFGVMDTFTGSIEKLYEKLYRALIPALFHSTGYATQPIYWTMVEEEDFDLALDVMFGEKGSETRNKFAGLIAKITNYREKITSKRDMLYKKFSEEYKIHIGVMAKYGLLNAPFTVGHDDLADGLVSLKDSSLGATCAKINEKLSGDYIAGRIAAGYGDYISPDMEVDASTCMFPKTTWFIKNVHHDDFERVGRELAVKFLNGTGVNVENSGFARFRVNDYEKLTVSEMTEKNCTDLDFISSAENSPSFKTQIASMYRWILMVMSLIVKFFTENFGSLIQ